MNKLGECIDIDSVLSGARSLVAVTSNILEVDCEESTQVLEKMYDILGKLAEKAIFKSDLIIAFGNYFVGEADPWAGTYTEPIRGEEAGVAGFYRGVCSIYVDEPMIAGNVITQVVPALEIDVADIELSDVSLGGGQLYSKVAVPLIGQTPVMFWNRNIGI